MGVGKITKRLVFAALVGVGGSFAAGGILAGSLKLGVMQAERFESKDREALEAARSSYDSAVNAFKKRDYDTAKEKLNDTLVLLNSLRREDDREFVRNSILILRNMIEAQQQIDNENYSGANISLITAQNFAKKLGRVILEKEIPVISKSLNEMTSLVNQELKKEKITSVAQEARPYYTMALAALSEGKFQRAVDNAEAARKIWNKAKVKDKTQIYESLARVVRLCSGINDTINKGRGDLARRFIKETRMIASSAGFPDRDKDIVLNQLDELESRITDDEDTEEF